MLFTNLLIISLSNDALRQELRVKMTKNKNKSLITHNSSLITPYSLLPYSLLIRDERRGSGDESPNSLLLSPYSLLFRDEGRGTRVGGRTPYSLLPTPYSNRDERRGTGDELPTPYSLLPLLRDARRGTGTKLPTPYSLLPIPTPFSILFSLNFLLFTFYFKLSNC